MLLAQAYTGTHPSIRIFKHRMCPSSREFATRFGKNLGLLKCSPIRLKKRSFLVNLSSSDGDSISVDDGKSSQDKKFIENKEDPVVKFQALVSNLPPVVFLMKRTSGTSLAIGFFIATAFLFIVVRFCEARKKMYERPGSVADLVRRGQLRSDRRGISRPLKYEDPFNNPLVKVGKQNSTVEMCGKVYKLAPVTLTKEEQAIHKKRRSRAYQWKRPTMFLKEGDMIPPDVDPDTVRWIPANHPFATTASDIDEDLAQTNVYQKHGVPFRIQAEHEELQRKLEALQQEQRFDKLVIDRTNAKDFERSFKFQTKLDNVEHSCPSNNQAGSPPAPTLDDPPRLSGSNSSTEEIES